MGILLHFNSEKAGFKKLNLSSRSDGKFCVCLQKTVLWDSGENGGHVCRISQTRLYSTPKSDLDGDQFYSSPEEMEESALSFKQ